MNLKEVVSEIKRNGLERILVTGPQRSGTTIAAKILAQELRFRFIDEENVHTLLDLLYLNRHATRFIIQGPWFAAYCHLLPMMGIIYMMRPIEEIIASEKRIGWEFEQTELEKYFTRVGPISEVKYRVWNEYQKTMILHGFELEYESMRGHPLWIDKENRLFFTPKQTEL